MKKIRKKSSKPDFGFKPLIGLKIVKITGKNFSVHANIRDIIPFKHL